MKEVQTSPIKEVKVKNTKFFNPFPGLRPFGFEDSYLFFGREGQSDELLKKLSENRFVALIGASGSGKSSLMYCGLVPTLHGGFIPGATASWKMVVTRPGDGPITQLAGAIVKSEYSEILDPEESLIKLAMTEAILRNSSLGLVEALKQLYLVKKESILLLVDQFEELFRYKKSKKDATSVNESAAFVKLLLEAVAQTEVPIYVVLTMRSDFIGDCAQFPSLTKVINDSHYLIPQMTRDNLHEAIIGPVAVGGGQIAPRLVQQLLNEVGDNPDQLPILQHALMRTWDYWTKHSEGQEQMDIQHYEGIGKMEKALSEHANEAFRDLSEKGRRVCETLFKTITEKGGDGRGIRHPARIGAIAEIANASETETIEVVEAFRKAGRSFLTPSAEVNLHLHENSIIDISHESLMRIWDRLKVWVDEEAASVQMYHRLSDASAMYMMGKTSLWRPPDLLLARDWKDKQNPNLAWALRFNPAYERTMVFLDTSIQAFETEEQNKIKLQKRTLKRTRTFAMVLGVAAVISLGIMVYAVTLNEKANKQKELAMKSEKEATSQKIEAEKQKMIALQSESDAKKQKEEAEKQKGEAEKQQKIAYQNSQDAMAQKKIADVKTKEAMQQSKIAKDEKGKAEKNAQDALSQKSIAEKASSAAERLRLLSISQSMAVKSSQNNKDANQKSLVAYQSYQYNKKYEGKMYNSDVFEGLYSSLKALNNESYNSLKGHTKAVRSIAFSPDGKNLYTAGSDGKILKWNMKDNTFSVFADNKIINRSIAFTSDGKWLACASQKAAIQLFDLKAEGQTKNLIGHKGAVWSIAFTPDNSKLISSGADSSVLLWDLNTLSSKVIAKGNKVRVLAINNSGTFVVGSTEDGKVIIYDLKNNTSSSLSDEKNNVVYALTFSNDGSLIATGDLQGNVKIWNLASKELLNTLSGHNARVNEIKFSPNDKMLASASYDHSIHLWSMTDLNEAPIILKDQTDWVMSMAFSPDGETLIAGCKDNLIRVYPTKSSTMADQICSKISRNMSQKEWNTYVGQDIPYEKTCSSLPVGEGVKE